MGQEDVARSPQISGSPSTSSQQQQPVKKPAFGSTLAAMVKEREREVVDSLGKPEGRLKAIRSIKNAVIGDKNKKLSYVKAGAVPRLVQVLQGGQDPESIVQALTALGSFAYGSEVGLRAVMEAGTMDAVLSDTILSSPDPRVIEAACRCLRHVLASEAAPRHLVFQQEPLARLLPLVAETQQGKGGEVAELVAQVLSLACSTPEHRALILDRVGLAGPIRLLSSNNAHAQLAALDLLAAVTKGHPRGVAELLRAPHRAALDAVLSLARADDPGIRLRSARVLSHLAEAWPEDGGGAGAARSDYGEVTRVAFSVLLKLLAEEPRGEAPSVLAGLLRSSEEMQRSACGSDTLQRLSDALRSGDLTDPKQREGCLRALAAFCLKIEDNRRHVAVEAKMIPQLTKMLSDTAPAVRAAACECLWVLSRSFKNLRSSFLDGDGVARPLMSLLDDPSDAVRAGASAALCNLVLEYVPLKEQIIKEGCLAKFVTLAQPSQPSREVRINALWALENVICLSKWAVREAVRRELPWRTLSSLLKEPDAGIQEKAFGILQNLLYGGASEIQTTLEWSDSAAVDAIRDRLASAAAAPLARGPSGAKALEGALYAATNLACGSEAHKDIVMSSGIAASLRNFLADEQTEGVKVAALWCLINLTWADKAGPTSLSNPLRMGAPLQAAAAGASVAARVQALRALGLDAAAKALAEPSAPLFVRERATAVVDAFARHAPAPVADKAMGPAAPPAGAAGSGGSGGAAAAVAQ